ncbi:TonB dependent receptor [Desulfobacula phenolica]|uniref:TonB dependent receptor n=1 Tax=Desulfobacula phenolica TaxID=90732 RepID=A0A1H2IRM4_9BACT|nr:TonB dependent receptor [Desulfobacula phenolica]
MHYDTGLFHKLNEKIDTRLSIYYIAIDNYIVANSGDSHHASSSYGYNVDKIAFYGFEAEFNAALSKKVTLFGNYTFRQINYDQEDILADAILLELSPEHKANLSIRYKMFENTRLTSDIRYVGERKTEGNVYNLDDFITVDVGIEQTLFKKIALRAYISNLFGEKYQEVYGYPLPEQTFGIRVKVTF